MHLKGCMLLKYLKDHPVNIDLRKLIAIGNPVQAYLRPISTSLGNIDPIDVDLLTEWRNRHVKSFLTEFEATSERTQNWLLNQVNKDDGKILFMLESLDGKRIGQVGLGFIDWNAGYGEADAIISGGDSPPGLMKSALKAALNWARTDLLLKELCVRVRSDNSALRFYEKTGFVEFKRVPLGNRRDEGMVCWYEDESLTEDVPSLVYMRYED